MKSITELIDALAQAAVEGSGANALDEWHAAHRPTREQALQKAEVFRAVNEQHGTNYPLPAWIAAAIGEEY